MQQSPLCGRFDIADIVRAHRQQLEQSRRLNSRQRRVLTDIAQCRTEALGGCVERCTSCSYQQPVYHSCRNRHCPKCQALAQEKWISSQRERMLDVKHFHIVFTLPVELRVLAAFAPRVVYNELLHTAGRTLLEFGERNLDATIGATLVLHTWNRKLQFHPHVHAIVSAGGLTRDGTIFRHSGRSYLFPVRNLGNVFRAKFVDRLWCAHRSGAFRDFDDFADPEGFQRLLQRLPKRWNVYAKASFNHGENVLQYLGRYTHRVAIANSRLLTVSRDSVTFRTKGTETETIHPTEFLRRFIRHVLPDGFHKIRHVGLNASVVKRAQARSVLGQSVDPEAPIPWWIRLRLITERDVLTCPLCKSALRNDPLPSCRGPPWRTATDSAPSAVL